MNHELETSGDDIAKLIDHEVELRAEREKRGEDPQIIRASSRRGFLRSSTIAGLVALPVVGAFASSAQAGFKGNVQDIERRRNQVETNFKSIMSHENTHVSFLVTALGSAARPKPTFQKLETRKFGDFAALAQALENTGVGAYGGAAPAILNKDYLAAAASIAFVEARHAGYLNDYQGSRLTAAAQNGKGDPAFDRPLTIAQVVAAAGPYIKSLNGGPALTFSATPSASNDIAILNFALALEYLEAEYYNINVAKFF